ncbi:cytochrome P450 [Morchella snyderi]|nr:cytochrome P450 [Morchella snyderi]
MLLEKLFSILAIFWQNKLILSLALIAYLLLKQTYQFINSPFRAQRIPGPFLASFTNFYRSYRTIAGTWHRDLMELHLKYGPVVWIAPDEVSCSDPYLRNVIYGFANDKREETFFRKAPLYETGSINEDFSFLFEREPEKARLGKRLMSHFYSETALSGLEKNFDQAVDEFVQGVEKHVIQPGKVCNLTQWVEYYIWDVTAQIACNISNGFCLAGEDRFGTLYGIKFILSVVGWLLPTPQALVITTRWIRRMLLVYWLDQLFYTAMGIGEKKWKVPLEERIDEVRTENPDHLLAKFHSAQASMRGHYPLGDTVQGTTVQYFNLMAGAVGVTPHTSITAIHHLLQSPTALSTVRAELAALPKAVTFADFIHHGGSNKIPYLEAVINEAVRICPAVGFSLSRTSPPAGCQLNQFFIPPGYTVGMSAWAVNYDQGYFGADAAEFKPERWLGEDEHGRKNANKMEAGWLSFGAGGRVCIGRHLAMFLMVKLVATIVARWELEEVKAPKERFAMVVEMQEMMVKIKKRAVEG